MFQLIGCLIMLGFMFVITFHKQINAWLIKNPSSVFSINGFLDAVLVFLIPLAIIAVIVITLKFLFGTGK